MRPGTDEEIPGLKRLCLMHRLMLIHASTEDEDVIVSGIGVAGPSTETGALEIGLVSTVSIAERPSDHSALALSQCARATADACGSR
jgi:hypothetical protein